MGWYGQADAYAVFKVRWICVFYFPRRTRNTGKKFNTDGTL